MTIQQDLTKPVVAPYVEMFLVDATKFVGPEGIWRLSSSSDHSFGFGAWGTFLPFPIAGAGFEVTSDQPPRPKLSLSNVTKIVQPYLQEYQGLVGAIVTRIRTTAKYLDSGDTPDDTQHLPLEVYTIDQLLIHDETQIQFGLCSMLDLPYVKLPFAQCLKDDLGPDSPNLRAPGLSRVRFRG